MRIGTEKDAQAAKQSQPEVLHSKKPAGNSAGFLLSPIISADKPELAWVSPALAAVLRILSSFFHFFRQLLHFVGFADHVERQQIFIASCPPRLSARWQAERAYRYLREYPAAFFCWLRL